MSLDSPRNNLKMREPIEAFATPGLNNRTRVFQVTRTTPAESNEGAGMDMSPPDSQSRESTRVVEHSPVTRVSPVTAQDNISSIMQSPSNGASPMLSSSNSTSRGRLSSTLLDGSRGKQVSAPVFAKSGLDFSGGESIKRSEPRLIESENNDETEDDRPSCTYKYIGSSGKRSVGRNESKGDSGLHTTIITRSLREGLDKTEEDLTQLTGLETSPVSSHLLLVGVILGLVVVMVGVGVSLKNQQANIGQTDEWSRVRKEFRSELTNLKMVFQNQTKSTFRDVYTAIIAGMQPDPEHPGVLVLLSGTAEQRTTACLANHLLYTTLQFSRTGTRVDAVEGLIVKGEGFSTQQGKADFHDTVDSKLAQFGGVAILGLERLTGDTAIALQGFADDSVAPYKRSVILMSLHGDINKEPVCDADAQAERLLAEYWQDLGTDKVSALISRVTASVVKVQQESEETLGKICPNL